MEQEISERFGRVHRAIHANGRDVLDRVLVTCDEMLRDRGCTRVVHHSLDATGQFDPVMEGHGSCGGIRIYVHGEDKVGVKFARIIQERTEDRILSLIISVDGPTPFTKKECNPKRVQFMTVRNLCVNVTRHSLVPKHEVVTNAPDGVSVDKLPPILDSDPIVQYYNWPAGTIVRVWRRFAGYEPVPYFRRVSSS